MGRRGAGAQHTAVSAGADIPDRLTAALESQGLLEGVRRLGVAVSGGADSVALLCLLAPICRRRGIALIALHLNHGLRGGASAGDAAFVRDACAGLGVACEVGRARGLAGRRPKRRGACQSIEMAAREARRSFFRRCARAHRLDAVAVAHHRDDAAETVLLRLARGAGAAGLAGMRPQSRAGGLRVIRPLLGFDREELRAWLRLNGRVWREDESNGDLSIPRNRVRHAALPLLEEAFGHGVADGLARSADLLREDDAALDALAAEAAAAARAGRGLAVARLTALPAAIARRVVHRWLLARGGAAAATFDAVRRVLENLDGKSGRWQFTAGGGLRVCRRGAALAAARPAASPVRTGQQQPGEKSRFLRRDGTVSIGGLRVTVRRARGIARESGPVGRLPAQCTIHAGAVRGKRLAVRFRKPGDRIAPIGLSGSRKVQDVLTDAKLPAEQRDTIPLLVCGGEVVWIPGYRVAARYAVPGPDAPSLRVTIRRALTPRIRPSRASPPRR